MLSKCCARCLADVLIPEGIQVELARPEDRGKELTYLGREKGQPQAEPTEEAVAGSSAEALGHIAVPLSLRSPSCEAWRRYQDWCGAQDGQNSYRIVLRREQLEPPV